MPDEPEKEPPLARIPEAEITSLARQIVTNVAYAAWDANMLENSFGGFLALAVGSMQEKGEDVSWMNEIGLVWEYYEKAMERSVNGYPCFMSANFIHIEDRPLLQREVLRMQAALGLVTQEQLDEYDAAVAEAQREQDQQQGDDG